MTRLAHVYDTARPGLHALCGATEFFAVHPQSVAPHLITCHDCRRHFHHQQRVARSRAAHPSNH